MTPAPRKPREQKSPGNIEQRAGVYRLRLHVAGEMHRFTFPPDTPIAAVRKFAKEKHQELQLQASKRERRTGSRKAKPGRVSQLLTTYESEYIPLLAVRSQASYREHVAFIRTFFVDQQGDPRVEAVGSAHVEAFLAWRRVTRGDPFDARRYAAKAMLERLEAAGIPDDELLSRERIAAALGLAPTWIDLRSSRKTDPIPYTQEGPRRGRTYRLREVRAWLRHEREREHRRTRSAVVSNRTVQLSRAILHRIFRIADRLELREGNPVARTESPKVDAHTPVILNDPAYERLLAETEGRPMLRLYLMLLGEGGLRSKSEGLWVRWEDVDLDGGFLWIPSDERHRTKGGKGRWVPLTARLVAAFREHFAAYRLAVYDGQRTPWVFHHERSRRTHRAGARIASLDASVRAAVARAGLPEGFRTHDLRHRRVTTWLADGKSAVHVKEAVGHADLKTTMGYTHLAREHLRALVDSGRAGAPTPAPSAAPSAGAQPPDPARGTGAA